MKSAAPGKRETVRKRRLARLPIAPDIEAPDRFEPTGENWHEMESAYGVHLNESQRAEIRAIVDDYLSFQPIENAAPFAIDAERWLIKLMKSIDRSRKAMVYPPIGASETVAAAAAHSIVDIQCHFQALRPGEQWSWGYLQGFVRDLSTACEKALEDVSKYNKSGGIVENNSWELMALRLMVFAVLSNLPSGVSKGSNKSRTETPSSFIAFFAKLQKLMPERYRRHQHSLDALAEAVSVVRRRELTRRDSKEKVLRLWKTLWADEDIAWEPPR
jgi:hypothetical protein